MDTFVSETMAGIEIASKHQRYMVGKLSGIHLHHYALEFTLEGMKTFLELRNVGLQLVALAVMVYVGNEISISYSYLLFGTFQLSSCFSNWRTVVRVNSSLLEIFKFLSAPRETQEDSHYLPLKRPIQTIQFKDVHLSYGSVKALNGLNLTINAGTKVAFCGRTGSGKTSTLSLLAKLYAPTRGEVLVDGVDMNSLETKEVRRVMSVVPQQGFLFEGTVQENLGEGNSVKGLEGEMHVEHDGSNLSSGQRQLINLGYATSREDNEVICLDEVTASMDESTSRR